MKKYISFLLVLVMVVSATAPALAGGHIQLTDDGSDSKTLVKGVVVTLIVGGIYLLYKHFKNKGEAEKYYNQGDRYARQGLWEKAVTAYTRSLDIYSGYKDAASKLKNAKIQAELMLISRGEQAENQEKFEEAISYYQKALKYNPGSLRATSKLNKIAEKMVETFYRRGYNYEIQNKWQSAYQEYEKAYTYNSEYEDLKSRYFRAKAKVNGNLPLRAIIFVLNQTGQVGLEKPFVNQLQIQMQGLVSDKFYLIDQQRVQTVMDEQAEALGQKLDKKLAGDIGRILGVDQVMIGELKSISEKFGSLRLDLTLKIIDVKSLQTVREVNYLHKFSSDITGGAVKEHLDEVARNLVDENF